jgi:N-carbamoyl-L-amino-acid hydrolase
MGDIGTESNSRGVTRLALTKENKEARDLLVSWLREEGLDIKIDPIGNIFGIREGEDPGASVIASGSHLDTVRNAGIYDGALGVLSALEVIRRLNEEDIRINYPLAVACFTNEEGARFQPDMMGSAVFSQVLELDEALKRHDDNGVSVQESLENINYKGEDSVTLGKFIELHVEQGPFLFETGIDIGVVEGIQGIAWWHGEYLGEANHAGTTPIRYRKDSLLACAELCCKLRSMAESHGENSVSTMGRIQVEPDIINVIPQKTKFTIDFRQYDNHDFLSGKGKVEDLVREVAEKHGLKYSLENVADIEPVRFNSSMVKLVETTAKELKMSYTRMHSGAGHDAGLLSHICPTSMIFIPSIKGKSHSPEEETSDEAIINGANLLLGCLLSICEPLTE